MSRCSEKTLICACPAWSPVWCPVVVARMRPRVDRAAERRGFVGVLKKGVVTPFRPPRGTNLFSTLQMLERLADCTLA